MFAHKYNAKMTKCEDKTHPLDIFRYCPVCGSPNFVTNNEKSKRCADCGFVYFFNPSGATVAVIVNERDELLVVRRAKEPAKGTLDLPGGFLDCAETAEEGVAREVFEETGLVVEQCDYLFSIPNIYPYSGLDVHTMDLFFLCRVKGTQEAKAMDDAESLAWIPWGQIMPQEFGLLSVRKGIIRLKMMWTNKK
jgi:mutator protein MutT